MASPRQPRTGEEAEKYAAEHLQSLGWPDAAPSGSTSAADIDIIGGRPDNVAVAQVVLTRAPTEARTVCAVRGAGYAYDARTVALFSRAGFTVDAVEWADRVRVALFEFAADGSIRPHGKHAAELVTTATAPAPPTPGKAPEPTRGRHADSSPRTGSFNFTSKIPVVRPRRKAGERAAEKTAEKAPEKVAEKVLTKLPVTPAEVVSAKIPSTPGIAPEAVPNVPERIAGPTTGSTPAMTGSVPAVTGSVPAYSTMSIPKAPTPPPHERWVPDSLGPVLDAIARAAQLPVVLVLGSDQRAEWVRQTFQVPTITVTDESVLPMLLSLVTGRESQYASGDSYHKVDGLKPQGERALESWRAWEAYDRAMAIYRRAV
ncbi:hypothetical protein J2S40_003797 [Nocardioides luteus]|uniref:Restriction endonuclease type IV Mrr domain-containing protein n=1 Tax=Nocardioides luteus TaxID=1844 RepID=A0ABQ5SYR3_9ACTN|nr:hypothetical protein [Nocardioides luteus]MDR7312739.1 hypothetical protein [Nocardioides luteus]GGR47219.1 hypothetical protein GCM10010197_11270 [Nocardioides luteus]GLJ68991.1 hypothetical protein GCM10017579_30270 [Nocardioides luteus]